MTLTGWAPEKRSTKTGRHCGIQHREEAGCDTLLLRTRQDVFSIPLCTVLRRELLRTGAAKDDKIRVRFDGWRLSGRRDWYRVFKITVLERGAPPPASPT